MTKTASEMIDVENFDCPGQVARFSATSYHAMRAAYLGVLSFTEPGQTRTEILAAVKTRRRADLSPVGKTSGECAKTVQLNLEAKGLVIRANTKPLRWRKR